MASNNLEKLPKTIKYVLQKCHYFEAHGKYTVVTKTHFMIMCKKQLETIQSFVSCDHDILLTVGSVSSEVN